MRLELVQADGTALWSQTRTGQPVQLEGMRMLLTPLPQEEFNLTDDRKSPQPQMGVACFDCHLNGHTTGQFHLSPDIRPQAI